MPMITFEQKGTFDKTDQFFKFIATHKLMNGLEKYAQRGVEALSSATPLDSGKTADLWDYEIVKEKGVVSIYWTNSNVNDGVNIAVILQYGHGTRTGGWVEGSDYINPAIRPIFDEIADAAWKELTSK